jgi:hypothetical protein
MDNCSVLYETCMNCRNFVNCLQLIRKPDPLYTVKCPCFDVLNLEILMMKLDAMIVSHHVCMDHIVHLLHQQIQQKQDLDQIEDSVNA